MAAINELLGPPSPVNASVATNSLSGSNVVGHSGYRKQKVPNTFSRAHLTCTVVGAGESYARSLFSTGNGYSPWRPQGIDMPRSKLHFEQGVTIGDVGLLDPLGSFVYLFNIFAGRDHPLNEMGVPEDFEPLVLDRDIDVVVQPDYFPPRTVISSKGVEVTQVSEDPFEFKFVTTVREGALLVLPDGASREDLKSSSHLTKYIEKYALSWHYFTFHRATYSGGSLPNGSLHLVTGCDRAKSWSVAAFPVTMSKAGDQIEMSFRKDTWTGRSYARSNNSSSRSREDGAARESSTVNIRGITIALSNRVWAAHLRYQPKKYKAYYRLLSTPILGRRAKLTRWKEDHFGYGLVSLKDREQFPQADVAIVHDSVWCNAVDSENGDGTAKNIFEFIARGIASCDIVLEGRTATLVPKSDANSSDTKETYKWAMKKARKIVRLR
ncbi:hypothetical protein D9613_012845 [Agrocybe pediades]|uniref:Uncharacterized protein n=1 Tax=Agrocybe pediades TaxID=84607 RepID=A0A8H4VRU3_9AGAR|nr:hypothetical protein D9613_012845 [Agrocybe pediades]